MKIGDYIRTKYGISKIVPDGKYVKIDEENNNRMHYVDKNGIPCEWEFGYYVWTKDIIKSSPNIIDLIEVGDYVNGHKVLDIAQAPIRALYLEDISQTGALIPVCEKDIKSIVTKEQFENMEYEVK